MNYRKSYTLLSLVHCSTGTKTLPPGLERELQCSSPQCLPHLPSPLCGENPASEASRLPRSPEETPSATPAESIQMPVATCLPTAFVMALLLWKGLAFPHSRDWLVRESGKSVDKTDTSTAKSCSFHMLEKERKRKIQKAIKELSACNPDD